MGSYGNLHTQQPGVRSAPTHCPAELEGVHGDLLTAALLLPSPSRRPGQLEPVRRTMARSPFADHVVDDVSLVVRSRAERHASRAADVDAVHERVPGQD